MAEERAKRKMSAILSADVKGYSRLMSQDEEGTVKTLKDYRETVAGLVSEHRGRVVDSPGDNILAEFGSVVDATRCAVEIQKTLKGKNEALPDDRKMSFRIGVNLGDVIEEEGRIYGDGVNIAARLEGLAEGGGICISGTAFDHAKNKLAVGYQYLGEQAVKNIPDPVRAYKVLMKPEQAGKVIGERVPRRTQWHWVAVAIALLVLVAGGLIWNFYWRAPKIEPASKEKMAFPLPDKPSIAVLPFVNMSDDKSQEFFSDGITDQIIASLSKIQKLFVIERNSTFTYKGKPVRVKTVAEELGVRYVLEGSVQKSGDRIRITAQLVDALKGDHLWSERYDRSMKDIFALQDEITMKIVEALRLELTTADTTRSSGKGTQNLEAFLKFLQGWGFFLRMNPDDHIQAAHYFQEAIDLDPKYAAPHVFMSMILSYNVIQGRSNSPKETIEEATKFAEKARELDESYPPVYLALAVIERRKGQFDKAINNCERGLALDPNSQGLLSGLGFNLMDAGRLEEAILHFKRAIRLNPLDPSMALQGLGQVYCRTGRYEEAIPLLKQAIRNRPQMFQAHLELAACYAGLGKEEEAHAAAAEVLKMNPKFTVEGQAKVMQLKDKALKERYLENLRKAGLPEKPPLPLPDKPSIAVLPFVNMSDDKSQEYFSDGLTEEIITALSKTPKLFIIARNSTFVYKGKAVNVQKVSRELGVKYILEGSVQKSGNQVRITAQLIDATTGNHLWAERYDRELKDIFVLQDEIAMKLIEALQVELTEGEQARMHGKGTQNLEAYLLCLQAQEENCRMNKDGLLAARRMAQKAIDLDPNYARSYHHLAMTYANEVPLGLSTDPRQSIARAVELEQKALSLDDSLSLGHGLLGWLYILQRQHDKGIAECEQAVRLEPNSARAHFFLSVAFRYAGRAKEAVAMCKEAIRLDPIPVSIYYQSLTNSYCLTGQYEEALAAGKQAVDLEPNNMVARAFLAVAYSLNGEEEEASIEAKEVMRIDPKFSVDRWAKAMPYKKEADEDLIIGALRKAGLK
jgi:adenylate cyclase